MFQFGLQTGSHIWYTKDKVELLISKGCGCFFQYNLASTSAQIIRLDYYGYKIQYKMSSGF